MRAGWTGWLLPGALLFAAAVLLVFTVVDTSAPAPQHTMAATPISGDDHDVAMAGDVISGFGADYFALVRSKGEEQASGCFVLG